MTQLESCNFIITAYVTSPIEPRVSDTKKKKKAGILRVSPSRRDTTLLAAHNRNRRLDQQPGMQLRISQPGRAKQVNNSTGKQLFTAAVAA